MDKELFAIGELYTLKNNVNILNDSTKSTLFLKKNDIVLCIRKTFVNRQKTYVYFLYETNTLVASLFDESLYKKSYYKELC